MSGIQLDAETQCPWCFEQILILIDPSVEEQTYIEDCSVCCRPILLTARCENDELIALQADRS